MLKSETSAKSFRRPKQARSAEKFEKLLDATHELVVEKSGASFNLGDVAKKAGVPTSTAYHFFSNIDAAFAALVGRYDDAFGRLLQETVDTGPYDSWQDLIGVFLDRSRHYVNENPQLMALFIGPGRTIELQQVSELGDVSIADGILRTLRHYWRIPQSPPPREIVHVAMQIVSGCWELSIHMSRRVDERIASESERAVIAYLRSYWPEQLEPIKTK